MKTARHPLRRRPGQRLDFLHTTALRCAPWLLGLALAGSVQAQTAPATDAGDAAAPAPTTSPAQLNYVLGVAYGWSPTYTGSDKHESNLSPVLSLQYGRFRLSSSRGNAVLNHGYDDRNSGASATLRDSMATSSETGHSRSATSARCRS